MRIVIQKVKSAQVVVDGSVIGKIGRGFLLFVGIETGDSMEDVKKAAAKIFQMRIMPDEHGDMNLALNPEVDAILSISQFTLAADVRKGNRPSFIGAMRPDDADILYQALNQELRSLGLSVETGKFQAHMDVELVNDGPITIIMDVKDGKVV